MRLIFSKKIWRNNSRGIPFFSFIYFVLLRTARSFCHWLVWARTYIHTWIRKCLNSYNDIGRILLYKNHISERAFMKVVRGRVFYRTLLKIVVLSSIGDFTLETEVMYNKWTYQCVHYGSAMHWPVYFCSGHYGYLQVNYLQNGSYKQ